nr:hypothetical protein [Pseudomonadota bacterium]
VFVSANNCTGTDNVANAIEPCFGVTYLFVPQSACVSLVAQTTQLSMGVQQVMINGADAGDANGGPPLPVTASIASARCDNSNGSGSNTIEWIYKLKGDGT